MLVLYDLRYGAGCYVNLKVLDSDLKIFSYSFSKPQDFGGFQSLEGLRPR